MGHDLTLPVDDGLFNYRVGAIIQRDGLLLMVENPHSPYLYSVGGRVRFGETAEGAVLREVEEETGTRLEIDRLGFFHENFFIGDWAEVDGKPVHELSLYFYMKTPADFEPLPVVTDVPHEHLIWVPKDTPRLIYPTFFRTELGRPGVGHFVTDER